MEVSIFLAQTIGIYCIIAGLSMFLNAKRFPAVYKNLTDNVALTYIGGIIGLVIGLPLITFHNIWVADWPVIITIFGWIGVLKGTLLMLFPEEMLKLSRFKMSKPYPYIAGVIALALGAYLLVQALT